MYPHFLFEVLGPQDKLNIMKGFVDMRHPGLSARIDFRSHDLKSDEITPDANVYIVAGVLQHKSDDEVVQILESIFEAMHGGSRIMIVDSILPNPDRDSTNIAREGRCRDMIMRQLQNSGDRALGELEKLAEKASEGHLGIEATTWLPGSTVATVVFAIC